MSDQHHIDVGSSLEDFARFIDFFLPNIYEAPPAGFVVRVDAYPALATCPTIAVRLTDNANYANGANFLFGLRIVRSGEPALSDVYLKNECPASISFSRRHSEADAIVGTLGTALCPQLAEAFGVLFNTTVELNQTSTAWINDSVIWQWSFTVGDPAYKFFSIEFVDEGEEYNSFRDPLFPSGPEYDWPINPPNDKYWRGLAGSQQHSPHPTGDTGSGSAGSGGGGGSTDLTPLVDAVDRLRGAVDDISLNASVNHGEFEVSLRGADGAGDGGGGG